VKRFLIALCLLTTAVSAHAWSRQGHQLVGQIAEAHLSPQAAKAVHDLLGADTLASVAPYADEYRRDHTETGPWHYVDIPSTEAAYDRERDCPAKTAGSDWKDCAVDRIPYFVARLKNTSLSKEDRAFALKMIVHFVGDIHQPFHALGDARGGNGIQIEFFHSTECGRYHCNLHGIWDDSLIAHRGISQEAYYKQLESEIATNHWDAVSQGNPTLWANEAHKLAVHFLLPDKSAVNAPYYDEAIVAIDRQLGCAGIRLARLLNAALTPAATPTVQ